MDKPIDAMHATPGNFLYYSLDELNKISRDIDWNDCGICEHDSDFWIGTSFYIDKKNVLRVPLYDILERRGAEYPEWGDEETYVFVGLDGETKELTWFLYNQDEFNRRKELESEKHYC